ncbi:hypothetical protein TNCT_100091 [Trichonephila clavata]|uniref:Uncharacterized protein n=1 Tax=Trichonephila clavata TaxID=2740835 RepID=A0A8X6KZE2_TRICU|nr:hypothetical protein TNCT_100091 [Trichonephila clavata]
MEAASNQFDAWPPCDILETFQDPHGMDLGSHRRTLSWMRWISQRYKYQDAHRPFHQKIASIFLLPFEEDVGPSCNEERDVPCLSLNKTFCWTVHYYEHMHIYFVSWKLRTFVNCILYLRMLLLFHVIKKLFKSKLCVLLAGLH